MSSQPARLSLYHAVLTNVNIMVGSGVFVNTVILAQAAGILGSAAYALVGIAILPIMASLSGMLRILPESSFYDFGATLHPTIGFLTQWGYFFGKLSSGALSLHVCMQVLQGMFPVLGGVSTLALDIVALLFFSWGSTRNLRSGGSIQGVFLTLKALPILFMVFVCLGWYRGGLPAVTLDQFKGMIECVPFIVFAFAGFEAVAALSPYIEKPEINGPRAVTLSWIIVLSVVMAYQSSIYLLCGPKLLAFTHFYDVFPYLAHTHFPATIATSLTFVLLLGIAASSLGSSYGVMFSNVWNLQRLAKKNLFWGSSFLAPLNAQGAAARCVAFQALVMIGYLVFSQGSFVVLQQLSALGTTIAYSVTCVAYTVLIYRRKQGRGIATALLSCVSSLGLFITALVNGAAFGYTPYIVYCGLLGLGALAHFISLKNTTRRVAH